jgi:hypothetical protein
LCHEARPDGFLPAGAEYRYVRRAPPRWAASSGSMLPYAHIPPFFAQADGTPKRMGPELRIAVGAVFAAMAVACLTALVLTYRSHPLFPFRFDRLDWTAAWLEMTAVDYYGAALPLCAVILAAEPSAAAGATWVAGVLLLGSPVACGWAAHRLLGRSGGLCP